MFLKDRFLFNFIFRFPSELNVGHISAETLWTLLSADLKDDLEGKFYWPSVERNARNLNADTLMNKTDEYI